MKIFLSFALFALPALLCSAVAGPDSAQPAKARYIVHLESPAAAVFKGFGSESSAAKRALAPTHAASAGKSRFDIADANVKAYRSYLAAEQDSFEKAASSQLGRTLKSEVRIDLVLNAVVLELSPAEASALSKLQGVARIEPDFVHKPLNDAGPAWVNAPMVWSGGVGAPSRGAGVVIGVIDTGINASHPSFAGIGPIDGHRYAATGVVQGNLCASSSFTPCTGKLIAVKDFSTGSISGEVDDGLDVDGHGSHVASIAAGNVLRYDIQLAGLAVTQEMSGVAPHASLISYKACEKQADCLGSWLLAAINAAVADRVDVINYSIGGDPRHPWADSSAQALLAAREAGIVPVVAAGNLGPAAGSIRSPGNSPWVISVASASHNRRLGSRLVDFSGGGASAPDGGSLLGASGTAGYGPARVIIPEDFPGCSIGSGNGLDLTNVPDGSSNPWGGNSNRFNGEIVVCLRGTHARIAKGDNVRRAGAGGMILVNTIGDGESVVSDNHTLPATHLGYRAGELLRQWLAAGGQSARIEGAWIAEDDRLADRLASSSGRGPVDYGGVMAPSIAAPGIGITAAAGSGNGTQTLSGTSMAAPHVAGAAALLRALKPAWRVDQIQSALMSTARSGLRREDDVSPARRIDVGAGGLDVATAALAQLELAVSGAEFRAADPATSGQPRSLNLPGLAHERCFETCALARTVRDIAGGGRWRVSATLARGAVSVQPQEFQLAAGASQQIQLGVDLTVQGGEGGWLDGEVVLTRVDGPSAGFQQRLPLAVFADPGPVPALIDREVTSDSGFVDLPFAGLIGLTDLVVTASEPSPVFSQERRVRQSATPTSPFTSIDQNSFVATFPVPAALSGPSRKFLLRASAFSATAPDIDLYAGIDYNGDGRPDEVEKLCTSNGPASSESCELEIVQTGSAQTVWVLVHSFQEGSVTGDQVKLEAALHDTRPAAGRRLVASAPAQVPSLEPFSVRLSWSDPTWLPGEARASLLSLRSGSALEPLAMIPVVLRNRGEQIAPRQLEIGVPLTIRLAGGSQSDRLFMDLPSVSGEVTVRVQGGAEARLTLFKSGDASGPRIPALPQFSPPLPSVTGNPAAASGVLSSGENGRWYAQVQNRASTAAEFVVTATLASTAPASRPRPGSWYNPARGGSGLFLFDVGGSWGLVWYTYLEDGTPAWYSAAAPAPTSQASTWSASLSRMTWNGSSNRAVEVGRVHLSFQGVEAMRFAFELDGNAGSEPMVWIGGQGCPAGAGGGQDLNGLWFDAANSGFGYSIDASPGLESIAQFLYDGRGMPRWAFGSVNPFGAGSVDMLQYSGACPLCEYTTPSSQVIGSSRITYASGTASRIDTDLQLAPPLIGSWVRSHDMTRLSGPVGCSP